MKRIALVFGALTAVAVVSSVATAHIVTNTDNLDNLAAAITSSNGTTNMNRIRSYAVAQAAATQSQELAIRELHTHINQLEARIEALEGGPPAAACADGVDNDSDGKTDFPADPGCVDANDNDETDPVTPPPATISQTIVAGSTIPDLNAWRAVFDANGDGTEDDPGSVRFLIDGNLVLTEINAPFGDTFANGTITTSNGQHTFRVEAVSDGGTLLASNSVVATVQTTTPPPTGFPDASNTGVPDGTMLTTYTGPSTITTPGTVIDSKVIGCIRVAAPGVIIRRSKVSCAGNAIFVDDQSFTDAATPLLVEDSEVDCKNTRSHGVAESDLVVRRVEITGCENGFDVNQNITVEDSYIHNLYNGEGSHLDGAQMSAGHWNGSSYVCCAINVTFRHNTMFAMGDNDTSFGTASIIFNPSGDENILVENNLFAGGSYTLHCTGWNGNGAKGINVRFFNNHFTTRFKSTVGWYGIALGCANETQSGNVIHETGQPITLG